MKDKGKIKINTEAPSIWEALSPDKAKKFVALADILFRYSLSDIQLGQLHKFVTLDSFLKSEQFEKIELKLETDNDLVCFGFALALAFRGVEDQIKINQVQNQQVVEQKPTLIIPNEEKKKLN